MSDSYIKSHEVWSGNVTTYQQPGSFPVVVRARVVEVGHMESFPVNLVVETQHKDALEVSAWSISSSVDVVKAALTAYIMTLR